MDAQTPEPDDVSCAAGGGGKQMDEFERIFAPPSDTPFAARYDAQCHCGTVRYHVYADPVDAKI
ncbi:MAG: hypothetical protein MJE12_06520, partial [Alphaproteobacteria bacterium]|nr:hypothetical protein [Alphaproteobacteria bacterium]